MSQLLGMGEITAIQKNVKQGSLSDVVDEYNSLFRDHRPDEKTDERRAKYSFIVDTYYNVVTSFYEYGWGQSFHFATRFQGETFAASMVRHEHFLASYLGVTRGSKVLDMGCGVGGPMRNIARFTGASVTGITINEYQVSRARLHNKNNALEQLCQVVQGNFLKLPFADNSFDAAYAIEATCHAPRKEDVYKEAFRAIKPGGRYCIYEWCMTDKYDPQNAEHRRIKLAIEVGDGLPSLDTIPRCVEAMKNVGFEVEIVRDLASEEGNIDAHVPWYDPLDGKMSLSGFKRTRFGRECTKFMLHGMEAVKLAPHGSASVAQLLNDAADALVEGGKAKIFTPELFIVARKPLNAK
eukprot:ANDGO_00257.mRNA.1 Cycloartenol-C-24-methyltransferase